MNIIKFICLMLLTSLLVNADEYSCKIDIVTDIDTKQIVSLPKTNGLIPISSLLMKKKLK